MLLRIYFFDKITTLHRADDLLFYKNWYAHGSVYFLSAAILSRRFFLTASSTFILHVTSFAFHSCNLKNLIARTNPAPRNEAYTRRPPSFTGQSLTTKIKSSNWMFLVFICSSIPCKRHHRVQ